MPYNNNNEILRFYFYIMCLHCSILCAGKSSSSKTADEVRKKVHEEKCVSEESLQNIKVNDLFCFFLHNISLVFRS